MPDRDLPPGFSHALQRCRSLAERLRYLEQEVELTRISLREAWAEVPPMPVRPWRECRKCHKPTQDTLGSRAVCAEHVGDMAGVYAALMGDDGG